MTAFAVCLGAVQSAAGAERPLLTKLQSEIVGLVEEVEPSIVSIVRGQFREIQFQGADAFGPAIGEKLILGGGLLPEDPNFVPEQFGAGVIVETPSGRRVILTCQHVVSGGRVDGRRIAGQSEGTTEDDEGARLYVRLHDGRGFYAAIRAADPRSDLAVLVPAAGQSAIELPPGLPLSDAKSYKKGEIVFVFGNPYGVARDGSASVAWGIIGNILRRPAPFEFPSEPRARAEETIHHYGTLLQLDCRADLGFSGGATVNIAGELIGLTTSLAALQGYESTTGFAIPVNAGVRRILQSLLRGYEPEYGFLGVGPVNVPRRQLDALLPNADNRTGAVLVDSVKKGSPGDRAGVRANDVILAVDEQPVDSSSDLFRAIGLSGPGAKVALKIARPRSGELPSQRMTLTARLDKWPVINVEELVATVPRFQPWHGLTVDYATGRVKFLTPRLDPYPRGVVVLSATEKLGGKDSIGPGDFIVAVNGKPVSSPREFYSLVRNLERKAEVVTLQLAKGREVTVR